MCTTSPSLRQEYPFTFTHIAYVVQCTSTSCEAEGIINNRILDSSHITYTYDILQILKLIHDNISSRFQYVFMFTIHIWCSVLNADAVGTIVSNGCARTHTQASSSSFWLWCSNAVHECNDKLYNNNDYVCKWRSICCWCVPCAKQPHEVEYGESIERMRLSRFCQTMTLLKRNIEWLLVNGLCQLNKHSSMDGKRIQYRFAGWSR